MGGYLLSDNSSDQAGWLTPINAGADYDEELERVLSQWVRGITNLPNGLVRPRWTPTQATIPAVGINWCAFGITAVPSADYPAYEHPSEGAMEISRHEDIECLATFYGPKSQYYGALFRDGLSVKQNNDQLNTYGLSVSKFGGLTPAPELINNQWLRRIDITVHLRRKVSREYAIKNIVSAEVKFFGE